MKVGNVKKSFVLQNDEWIVIINETGFLKTK